MAERREPLMPLIGMVTDIRIDTPDVKTFRVNAPEGGKLSVRIGAQLAAADF